MSEHAHGNNVATLSRNGSGGFALANRRTYDAWGVVRSQQSGGDPKLRYCASLGHKQDDESGLVYMRARYYEPTSGRFISEDPGMDDQNWFAYCANNPVGGSDPCGKFTVTDSMGYAFFMSLGIGAAAGAFVATGFTAKTPYVLLATWSFMLAMGGTNVKTGVFEKAVLGCTTFMRILSSIIAGIEGGERLGNGIGRIAVFASAGQSMMLFAALLSIDSIEDESGGNGEHSV